jgi:hypothetical protein
MAKIYSSGNYVIVQDGDNLYEYAKGHTLYVLVDDIFYIKEITQGQYKVSVADLEAENITAEDSEDVYNVNTFTTFLRENTGFKTAPGGSGAEWGSITGTLSTQSDLQSALDAKQDELFSGTNIKSINGNSLLGSGNLVVGGSSGVFGISNSSGVYTYYATLTLAMAAAVAGQTIEMFADVLETGAVTITLKNGVTINGNGHSYNHTQTGTSDVFETTVAGIYRIYNLNVNRTNAIGGFVLNAKNFVASIHYFDGSHFTTNGGGIYSGSANVIQRFYNGNITITGTGIAANGVQDNEFYNFTLRATSTATAALFSVGVIYNSTFNHEGNATAANNLDAFNCTFVSRGGGHTIQTGRNISNCSIYNFANFGHFVNCQQFNNCLIFSATSFGSYTESTTLYKNCTIISSANIGAANGHHRNSAILSTAGIGASGAGPYFNSSIQSSWNNSGGHGIRIVANNTEIVECIIEVTNASANAINAASAFTSRYANNAFKGATTPVNANVTQAVITTHDLQGNILI